MVLDADKNMFEGMLEGKRVIVATGASISLYRMPDVIRDLRREGADITVGMSEHSTAMVGPEVMRGASARPVMTESTGDIEHISLFIGQADNTALLISTASYDTIGKIANGIADDIPAIFFSFAFGHGVRTVIAPAMHRDMMLNKVNSRNLAFLKENGVSVIEPSFDDEKAKLSESRNIVDGVCRAFYGNELKGRNVLIISGRGEEELDPVRVITNKGTGFTGYWFARNSYRLGADQITYVGNSTVDLPAYVTHRKCYSTDEIMERTLEELSKKKYDVVLVPASLSDFRVKERSGKKISSGKEHTITLAPREKIIREIRKSHEGFLGVFNLSEETDMKKIRDKYSDIRPDLIMCNDYTPGDGPFGMSTNSYRILLKDGEVDLKDEWKPAFTLKVLRIVTELLGKGSA